MRKPAFGLCENKVADQVRSNCAADQRLCFRFTDTTNHKPLAIFCGCIEWFVSDQVGNPEDRFSHNEAHNKVTESQVFSLLDLLLYIHCLSLVVRKPVFGVSDQV